MQNRPLLFILLCFVLLSEGFRPKQNQSKLSPPIQLKGIDSIAMRSVDGSQSSLKQYSNAKGFIIVFTCNHCPFAQLYSSRLNALHTQYSSKQVPLIAINSMDSIMYAEEGFIGMQEKAKKEGFKFPYLQDAAQTFGKTFHAEHTPQAFVIWKDSSHYNIKYQGSIDDNGQDSAHIQNHYIEDAVDALLNNTPVKVPNTESFGCRIFYRKP